MDTSTKARIETLVASSPIFVFMKGSKLMHRCGLGALHRALQLVKICDDRSKAKKQSH